MKFDYEVVGGSIAQIAAAIEAINAAIEDKVVNTTYKDGNAKDAVESYIATLNSCFDPIVPEVQKIQKDLQDVKDTYFGAENKITSGLNGTTDTESTK